MDVLNSASLIGVPGSDFVDNSKAGTGKGARLHDAAQQFEALMMEQMLKIAREESSDGWLGSGDEAGSDSALDLAQSQFARALASKGGFGIAQTIEKQLAPAMDRHASDGTPPINAK